MNALLLYPELPDTFWSFKHALRFVRRRASSPPLGLLTVAAMLPEDWDRRLVDLNVGRLKEADLEWADVALISAMTVQREAARDLIDRCKAAGLPVVAGGPLFTTEHESFTSVDHLVLNEAEITLPAFLDDFRHGRARHRYATTEYANLGDTPPPAWELVEIRRYASMPVQYSRGCPFDCDFCNVTALLGHRPRTKASEQIITELDGLYDRGWRGGVFFVDDNLIGNKRSLKSDLLPALTKWRRGKTGVSFNTQTSINLADDAKLLERMVDAGFKTVFIGIETPSEAGLAECSKSQNLKRDLLADVKRIQRYGIEVQGGFILGFDSDTPSTFRQLVEFVQQSGIVTAMVGLLQALPGTRLYDRLLRAGRLSTDTTGDNVDGTTNIVPISPTIDLHRAYRDVLEYLYRPAAYYRRVRTFLLEYRRPSRGVPAGVKNVVSDIGAFARSVVRLGILGRERFHYWRLLAWTLVRRPRSFPLAVRLAIYGYHFRRVCELHVV